MEKKGRRFSPVRLEGRNIANSFWGKAWCQNLESYGTYASRLPRGRSYVRNGAVVDLQIQRGSVTALVSGSELYNVKIQIEPLGPAAWRHLKGECAGKVGSLIDLLRGKLSGPVMEVITRKEGGLFPKPAEIKLTCSCPDYADMCKHSAAVLYGVGSRLDQSPELLFTLRGVDHLELFSESTENLVSDLGAPGEGETLAGSDLAAIFGIELDSPEPAPTAKMPAGPTASTVKKSKKIVPAPAASKPSRTRRTIPGKPKQAGPGSAAATSSRVRKTSSGKSPKIISASSKNSKPVRARKR